MIKKFANEVVILTEAIRSLLFSTIGMLIGFKVMKITPEQVGLVMAEFAAASGFLSAIARGAVTPNSRVALTKRDVGAIEAGQAQAQS